MNNMKCNLNFQIKKIKLQQVLKYSNSKGEKIMGVVYLNERAPKVLVPEQSTSIICNNSLLSQNRRLKRVAASRDNLYYNIYNTNACIMHVEADFCIITDYKVMVYNQPGVVCSLPNMLSASHYAVYQVLNGLGGSRDWVKNSATSQLIGYDIKTLIHGPGCAIAGDQLEHLSWTLDERELFKSFGPNKERDSHRIRIEISTMDELDQLIDKIIESERNKEPIKLKK